MYLYRIIFSFLAPLNAFPKPAATISYINNNVNTVYIYIN